MTKSNVHEVVVEPLASPCEESPYVADPMEALAAAIEASEKGHGCSIASPIQSEQPWLLDRSINPEGSELCKAVAPVLSGKRAGRKDRGAKRLKPPPSEGLLTDPLRLSSLIGSVMPALAKHKKAPLDWAYLPVGLEEALPHWTVPAFTYAALDFLDEMSRGDRKEYRPVNYDFHEARYGLVRLAQLDPCELIAGTPYTGPMRPRVWSVVCQALKDGGFIEPEESEWSDAGRHPDAKAHHVRRSDRATYKPKVSSIHYRLCEQWRDAPLCARVALTATYKVEERVTVSDGTPIVVPPSLAQHLVDVEFDLESAIAWLRTRAGAALPETQDYAALTAAIRAGQPPAWALEEVEAEREPDDRRTGAEIVIASVLASVAHLYRWRVDGRWSRRHSGPAYRDHRGHRLHSAITSLSGSLRRFLSFDSERLMQIDCANSQMVILAGALLAAYPDAEDGHDFADECAAGRFYETSHKVAHGTNVDPTKAQRKVWKSQVMGRFLYCSQKVQANAKHALMMAERWPTLHRYMLEQKAGGSAELPCRMQRLEAAIWIDALAPELEGAGIPGVTVHDSLLFPASRAAEVEVIVRRLYANAGLRAGFVIGDA